MLQGQFYGVTLEYRTNPAESIVEDLSQVKSVVMLVFRDAKNPDDELNAWEFWHQVRFFQFFTKILIVFFFALIVRRIF